MTFSQICKKALREWLGEPQADVQLETLQMIRELVKLQHSQSEMFNGLVKAWSVPPPDPRPYISPDDRELLEDLAQAAGEGDEDAKLILADDKLKRAYLKNFN